jgi:glyoxylase-like metal-dependent hydrolase (beta-lactamase superfamily II)
VGASEARLRALHTPGHASDHLCYLLEGPDEGLVFSGDHVMEGSTVVIAPPDGDMGAYLDSLRRLGGLRPRVTAIAPGHGGLITDPQERIEGYLGHRLAREEAIRRALGERVSASVEDLVAAVYRDVPAALHPVARFSVWAHLRKLHAEGRAWSDDPDDLGARWHQLG